MSTEGRIASTVAIGAILGLATLVSGDGGFPSAGVNAAIDLPFGILAAVVFLLAPVLVARWWVIGAMAGPLIALLILQVAGAAVALDDGTGPALDYRTLFQFVVVSFAMLVLIAVRYLVAGSRSASAQSDQPG